VAVAQNGSNKSEFYVWVGVLGGYWHCTMMRASHMLISLRVRWKKRYVEKRSTKDGCEIGLEHADKWAVETFGMAELGDLRRTDRLVKMATAIAENPSASLEDQYAQLG